MSMLQHLKQEADYRKRKVEKRRPSFMDTGACFKVPVLCVLILGLTALSLCGCGKLSGGKNLFQEENEIGKEILQKEKTEVSTEGENSGLVEEAESDDVINAGKPYADMLEQKSEEDIRAYFEAVPTESDAMKEKNYVILQWDEVINLDRYWSFEERYLAGEPADLILVQYTEDEIPYFDYLYFTGSDMVHFRKIVEQEDSSRSEADIVASEANQTSEIASDANVYQTYDYLHTFVQRAEERDRYKTLVLSNEKDLTYQEFETLFYQEDATVETEFIASFFYVEE